MSFKRNYKAHNYYDVAWMEMSYSSCSIVGKTLNKPSEQKVCFPKLHYYKILVILKMYSNNLPKFSLWGKG